MSFYLYKNLNVKLNNNNIIASDVQIDTNVTLTPNHLSEERHSFNYSDSDVASSLKLTYLLTGNDFLRDFLTNETGVISGNFGGLYFKSGYLKTYTIDGTPNNPINVGAEIVFFQPLNGTFSPVVPYNVTGHGLNFSDATLTTDAAGCESLGNILSLNYNYSTAIDPVYYSEDRYNLYEVRPNIVRYGAKQTVLSVVSDNMSGNFPIYGSNASVQVNFRHPYIANITDNLSVSGRIFDKNISTSSNNILKNTISIRQDYIDPVPTITNITPSTQLAGANVVINGTNLIPTIYAYFGSDKADILSSTSTALSVRVPYNAISSNIYVKTYGGRVSGGYFAVTYPPINIYRVNPITGRAGDNILISGTNFYRINKVRFGSGNNLYNASFMNINTGIINAKVPVSGIWDFIHVISDDRSKTGVSPLRFSPFPSIYAYSPLTGRSGTFISCTGYNFSGMTAVSINDVFCTGFITHNNSGFDIYLPSGCTRSFIKVFGPSGVYGYSQTKFSPVLFITGTLPYPSGNKGDRFYMSGTNFMPSIMSSGLPVSAIGDLRGFKVSFNGGITGLELVNTASATAQAGILLQGYIPLDAKSGPISIFQEDGASVYNSTGMFYLINEHPIIQRRLSDQPAIFPQTVISGDNINSYILGKNFFDMRRVCFSGSGRDNTYFNPPLTTNNYTIDVPSANWTTDYLGTVINIQNFSTINLYTGQYSVFVSGLYGTGLATGTDCPFIITSGLPWNNPDIAAYDPLA